MTDNAETLGVVYVVDDDDAVRDSLQWLLEASRYRVFGFESAEKFLAGYDPAAIAVAILDVRMPGMSGLELQEALNARQARLPVVLITGHGDVAMAVRAMKAGASDFIEKPFNDQVLLDAVNRALARARDGQGSGRAEMWAGLDARTPRGREVMLLVAEGRPNKVVATRLGLSTRTVEVHRAKLMEKMQARSLADLVRMAIACDLMRP